MSGRGGYNSPGGSGWTPGPRGGRAGRGGVRGFGGRGRGGRGGFAYTDMKSMSFSYGGMSVEDPDSEQLQSAAAEAATASSSSFERPSSRNQTTAYVSTVSNPPSFKPVFRPFHDRKPSPAAAPPQAGPSNYQQRNGFVPAAAAPTKHAGIGAANATVIGGRRFENHVSDGSLLKPVTFVKSASKIEKTIDDKEQEQLKAKQALQAATSKNANGSISRPTSAALMSKPTVSATTSANMSRGPSHLSSGSSKSGALSPLAAEYVHPSFLGYKKPVFGSPSMPKKEQPIPTPDDSALFYIDKVGERTNGTGEDEGEDSDTEELWPRSRVVKSTNGSAGVANAVSNISSPTSFPNLQPTTVTIVSQSRTGAEAAPAHIPIKPYARVVTDDMPLEQLFRPSVPQLSASAKEFVNAATNTGPSGKQDKSRKASKKQARKEAKERKKERRTNKKTDRRAFKASVLAEPKRPRTDDSDVEWGSNGPPSMDEDSDDDDESDTMDITASSSQIKGKIDVPSGARRRGKGGKKDAAIEAALADYAANIENDPEELEALKAFAKGMSGREQLTIGDLEDLAEITASDDSDDATSDDEAYEERVIIKDFVRAQGLEETAQPENFPVYVPAPKEPEPNSDPEDSVNEIWKTDDDEDVSATGTDMNVDDAKNASDASSTTSSSDDEEEEEIVETTVDETILIVSEGDDDSEESEDERELADMDDGDIDDLLFAATKAARRKRKGPAPTGADDIDDMLQAQWRKDREKKAIKRQERALARLEQKPSKANSKKAKRAAQKAKAFRDDDGDVMVDLEITGGRVPQFHRINQDLKDFIENSGAGEYALPAMDKKFRFAIHMLADAYNLKSKSRGNGRDRHNVLYRTQHTTVKFADHRKVNKFLSITATWSSGSSKSYSYERPGGKGSRKPGNANAGGGNAFVSRNAEGSMVGEGAEKIAADNIGYGLLAKMGWTEGMQIGKGGGISEPIAAVIKTSKAGLGSGWVRYNRGGALTPLQPE